MVELTVTIVGVACYLHKKETAFAAFPSSRILPLRRSPLARHASDCACVNEWSVNEAHISTSLTIGLLPSHYNHSPIQPPSTQINASTFNL